MGTKLIEASGERMLAAGFGGLSLQIDPRVVDRHRFGIESAIDDEKDSSPSDPMDLCLHFSPASFEMTLVAWLTREPLPG